MSDELKGHPQADPLPPEPAKATEAELLGSLPPADPKSGSPEAAYTEAAAAAALYRANLLNQSFSQDIRERRRYADKIYRLACWWLFAVLVLVVWAAQPDGYFRLSDAVLVTVLGSTTATVVTLFVIVVRYLFPRHDTGDNHGDGNSSGKRDNKPGQ